MLRLTSTLATMVAAHAFQVTGNNRPIADGEIFPSLGDGTRFERTCTGSSTTRTFTLKNTGEEPLSFLGAEPVSTSHDEFKITQPAVGEAEAGAEVTFVVEFAPTHAGQKHAKVVVATSAGEHEFGIAAESVVPMVEVQSAMQPGRPVEALELPTMTKGETTSVSVYALNYEMCGGKVVDIELEYQTRNGVAISEGGFDVQAVALPFQLNPRDENRLYFDVLFEASQAGTHEGTVVVKTDGVTPDYFFDVFVVVEAAPEQPTPGPVCVDETNADGTALTDSYGDGCAWYGGLEARCSKFGSTIMSNGKTANEACCACKPTCIDYTLGDEPWRDGYGEKYTCSWYESTSGACSMYGDSSPFPAGTDWSASTACCACGGGLVPGEQQPPLPVTPTPAPGSCMDYTLDDNKPWRDAFGEKYTCAWYASNPKFCSDFGTDFPFPVTSDWTASKACCACNGGVAEGETQPEPPATGGPQCVDYTLDGGALWHDGYGQDYTCNWYSLEGDRCEKFGSADPFPANTDWTANKACCACGGGELDTGDGSTPEPEPEPEPEPVCTDVALASGAPWHDSFGATYTCAWYATKPTFCGEYGSGSMNENQVANTACCVCGGGKTDPGEIEVEEAKSAKAPACLDATVEVEPGKPLPWHDHFGTSYNCAWYAELPEKRCTKYGDAVSLGLSAKQACCACHEFA